MEKQSSTDPKAKKKQELFRKKQLALANRFKDEVLKQYKDMVKAVVLFGSLTRGDFHEKSDIDMLVIIDDVMARLTPEMKDDLDDRLYDIAKKISESMTVQPAWMLSEFWDMARIGHPLLFTIVRDGWHCTTQVSSFRCENCLSSARYRPLSKLSRNSWRRRRRR